MSLTKTLDKTLEGIPTLPERAGQLSKTVHKYVLAGGEPVRSAVDGLHGTWLGHPLHPLLTDVVKRMNYTYQVLTLHPRQNQFELESLMVCLRALADCAQSCATCADACLNEPGVDELVNCIRLNFDCADICLATGRLLSGLTGVNVTLWRSQLQACLVACRMCMAECSHHAAHHEHCRVCAEACRQCELACHNLLATLAHM